MDKFFKLLTLMFMALFGTTSASADLVPMATPLETIILRSDFIVIGKIIKIEKDPNWKFNVVEHEDQPNPSGVNYLSAPGKYEFTVLHALKGMPPAQMLVTLPAINSMAYNGAEPTIAVGSNVLLFVKISKGVTHIDLLPTDPTLPLAVLDNPDNRRDLSSVQDKNNSQSVLQQVCNVLLDSLRDKWLLQANTYLLRDLVNPQISKKLMPFVDNPDEKIQSNVLSCLASNQVVEAIPRIAQLHAKIIGENGTGGCVEKLEGFQTKEALPYLNPLLFSPYRTVRFCTSMALRKMADLTSIPYLITGLADPDMTNRYECYATLTRLIPQLGAQKTIPEFDKNPNGICLPYINWWREELEGNHLPRH